MPTYVYTCDSCSHEFEREQRITEKPVKKCPQCGKLKARRMIGGGGFILKGGGWESDLYSGPSNRLKSDDKPKKDAKPKAGDAAASPSGGSAEASGSSASSSSSTSKAQA
jgi:putative FmdB family regulatory protein